MKKTPYREQIARLKAERQFKRRPPDSADHRHRSQRRARRHYPLQGGRAHIVVSALISFYEPHPQFIKGYVHENLSLKVAVGDTFLVRSTKDASMAYKGAVTGLGSRIVEIPERLRKMPDVLTYGREVSVQISPENAFLQKEKVALELMPHHRNASDAQAKK